MGWEPLKACSGCEQMFAYHELVYWVGEEYLCDICHDEAVEKKNKKEAVSGCYCDKGEDGQAVMDYLCGFCHERMEVKP
jgi:hypothetical protein